MAAIDTILLAYDLLSAEDLERVARAAPGARVCGLAEVRGEEDRVHVLLGYPPRGGLASFPNLRWVQQTGAGADWLMRVPEFRDSDVVLTNASGVHAIPIAEHVLALMFALSRRIHFFVKAQAAGRWERRGRLGELEGATLGIVGVGAIGEKLAQKAKGLGMRVLGMRRDATRGSPHVDRMFGPEGLRELLAESDWVVIAAALTPETQGLIGEAELATMKPTAYLINIGRGAIVDEAALVRALEARSIGGAGLDVFEHEPLPEDSPLWKLKNVIVTPHFAGATPHYVERVMDIFLDNLARFQAGEPMRNVVDKKLAY